MNITSNEAGVSRAAGWFLRHGAAGLLASTALLGTASAFAQAPAAEPRATARAASFTFAIPAQPLAGAIAAFASTTGLDVIGDGGIGRGVRSPGLSGNMTAQQALGRLLAGTGIGYRFGSASSVTLQPPADARGAALPGDAIALDTIDVEGSADGSVGYVPGRSSAGTKLDTPLMQTPQSISVVTRQQMVDQNVQSVSQALRYTPGIVSEQRGLNEDTLEYLYSRGFQAETYLDGLRLPATGFNIATRDAYLIDRVESVRGPSSVLYGQSPPGGLVNIVSKQPVDTPLREVFFQTGNYNRLQAGFDLGGPLNADKTLLYRLTGVGLKTDTQIDGIEQERVAIAPAITWRPNEDTRLTILGSYQKDPRAGIYNNVVAAGTVLPGVRISRSFNPGDPGYDRFSKEEASVGYSLEHRFNENWQFRQNVRYLYNDISISQVGLDGLTPDGLALRRSSYLNIGTVNALTIDNQMVANFDTGPLRHKAIFGFDYQRTQYDHYYIAGGAAPNLSLLNPVYFQTIERPTNIFATSNKQRLQQAGVYAQDQVTLGKLTVVGGLRQDWASTRTLAYKTAIVTDSDSHALTGRIGAIYNFDNGLAPYVSYSTSFQPLGGTTDKGSPLKPTEGTQYEIGLKYQPPGHNSYFTVSAFDLRQTNVTVSNSLYLGSVTQTGEVRSRGVELEARAYLTDNLQAIASYTYTDIENTKATANIQGKSPAGIPRNSASLWLSYDMPGTFLPGLKLSGGVRFVGSSYGDNINSFKVPSYTLVDLGVQYDVGPQIPQLKGLTAAVNVSNLFDKEYISSCIASAFCTFGSGRLVLASLRYRW